MISLDEFSWITYILFMIAGAMKAISDLYEEGKLTPGKNDSWKNKWKLDEDGKLISNTKTYWYYLWLWKPKYVEKFPYSSEFLVFLTDPWHRYNTFRMVAIILGMFFFKMGLNPILDFFIVYGFFAAGFTPTYRYFKYGR